MPQHLLCIDIGNTNIVLGLYAGEQLVTHWRVATDHARMPDEYAVQILALFAHGGYSASDIRKIYGENLLRVMRTVEKVAAKN